MATEYLTEGVNSFAATNWLLADGTAAAGTRGFKDNAELVIPGGGTSVTASVDWTTLSPSNTGITFLKIAERFSGNVGTASAPLKVDADATATQYTSAATSSSRIEHYGPGTLFYAGGTSGVCSNLFQMGSGRTVVQGSTTVTYLTVANGNCTIEDAATATNAYLLGGSCTLGTKTSAATLVNVVSGSHSLLRPATTVNVYGGNLAINVSNAGAATTVNIYGGNVVLYAHGNTAITAVTQYGGYLDVSQLRFDTTITTLTRYRGAQVSQRPRGASLTVTNDVRADPTISAI